MKTTYITNGFVVLEDEVKKIDLKLENGKITFLKRGEEIPKSEQIIDSSGLYVLAGFIDTHVHGGGGADFMDSTPEAFRTVVSTHAYHGTTSIMPTTLSAPLESIENFLSLYKEMQSQELDATLIGVHLEGPFLSPKQTGAQNGSMLRIPSKENLKFAENYLDVIKRIDIAPEIECGIEAGKYFADKGVLVSMGHSDALFNTVKTAIENGYSHVTHMHNPSPWARKVNEIVQAGIPEAAYLYDEMNFELIGDGYHIAPQTIEMAVKFKDKYRVSLVTDAMRAAGTEVKESYLGAMIPQNRVIIEGGVAKLPDRSFFAGSITTMDKVFFNVINNTRLTVNQASMLTSMAPAVLLGISDKKGSISEGKDADLVIADIQNSELKYVISRGRIIRKTV